MRAPEVVVVGAGPAGMTAAAVLASQGVAVDVLEAGATPGTDWRASTFHPSTLELLDSIGIAEQMHAEGLVVPRYQFRDRRSGLVAELDNGRLAGETRFPHRLQLNQQHLVRMLADRLSGDPLVRLRFGERVTGLEQDEDGVTVTTAAGDERHATSARFVIGADGAGSTVRRLLGTAFEGYTYDERFLIASTSVDMRALMPDIADVNYVADPDEWIFLLRTPESWRAVWPVPAGVTDEEALAPEQIEAHLQGIAARDEPYPVINTQMYRVHQRVAASFRERRAVLIGDAAHINSPLGGVGLNSGVHDAFDVTRRLVRVLREQADLDAELEAFAAARRAVALEHVQADTARNTQRLREKDPAQRRRDQLELREMAADPVRHLAWVRRASLLESVERYGIGRPPVVHA